MDDLSVSLQAILPFSLQAFLQPAGQEGSLQAVL